MKEATILEEKSIVKTLVPKEGLLLFILASINFTHIMDFVIMMPLGPQLMRVFEISPQQFSFLVAAYTFSAAVFGFIGSMFVDRYDRKSALIFLYIGFVIGTLCCALAPSYEFLMIARIVAGAFGGIVGALVLAVVGDAIPDVRRGKATGIVMSAFSVASVIGVPVGLYLASKMNWHVPFFMLTGVGVIVLALMIFFLPSLRLHMERKAQSPLVMLSSVASNPNLRWALLFMFMLIMAGFTVIPFISPYMVANVGFKEIDLSYIYLFGGAATAITGPLAGKMADKFGRHKVFIFVAVISIIPIMIITNLPLVEKYLVFLVSTFFFIFFGGRFVPAMAIITSSVERHQRGSFMSINSSVQSLSSGIAASIAGIIVSKTSDGHIQNFGWVGVLAVVCTILCIFIATKVKSVS